VLDEINFVMGAGIATSNCLELMLQDYHCFIF